MPVKSPVKTAVPVEPCCLRLGIASCYQLIQVTGPCICPSRTATSWEYWHCPCRLSGVTGVLNPSMVVTFAPVNWSQICWNAPRSFEWSSSWGQYVLQCQECVWQRYLSRWFVWWDSNSHPPVEAAVFMAWVIILDHPGQIKAGYTLVLNCHTPRITCKSFSILNF